MIIQVFHIKCDPNTIFITGPIIRRACAAGLGDRLASNLSSPTPDHPPTHPLSPAGDQGPSGRQNNAMMKLEEGPSWKGIPPLPFCLFFYKLKGGGESFPLIKNME